MFYAYVSCFEGGSKNSNFSQFQIFHILGTRGRGRQILNFSQIQNSPNDPRGRGGGQENSELLPLFGTLINTMDPLCDVLVF